MAEQTSKYVESPALWTGRLPLGLVMAMISLGSSLGVMLICWNLSWPDDNPFVVITRVSGLLCLGWGIVTHAVTRRSTRFANTTFGRDMASVLQVVQTTLALLVVVLIMYVSFAATLTRIPSLPYYRYEPLMRVGIWAGGSFDLALVIVALLLAWWRTGQGMLITGVLWLGVLASLWTSLQIPDTEVRSVNGIAREVWSDWVSPFVLGSAVTLTILTLWREWLIHLHQVRAWPDRLTDLLTTAPAWPGFRHSAGIIAAMILVLGCMTIVSPLSALSGLLAGAAMLILTHRRWDENYADAGLGLISLGVISTLMFKLPPHIEAQSDYFPAIFSRAVLGLAVLTYFWHWIAIVWNQQLDQGRPWTTAGRLIRPCRRVGFIVAATGVLVSLQLAFWPILPYVDKLDNGPGRWVAGLLPCLLLLGGTTWATRKTRKPTLGWLAIFTLLSIATFIITRIPGTLPYKLFLSYWPLVAVAASGCCIFLARRCFNSTAFRPFFEPLYISGMMLLPMAAISGTSVLGSRAIPLWVDPVTFIGLACVYLLTALLAGPRKLFILAAICAAAAVGILLGL